MPAGRYTLYFMLVDCLDCDDYYSVADIIVHPGNSKLLKEIMAALLKQYEKEMADFKSLTKNASGLSIRHQAPVRPTQDVLIEKAKSSLSNGKSRHFNKSWQGLAIPGNRVWLGKYWKILRRETFEPESYPWEVTTNQIDQADKESKKHRRVWLPVASFAALTLMFLLVKVPFKPVEAQPEAPKMIKPGKWITDTKDWQISQTTFVPVETSFFDRVVYVSPYPEIYLLEGIKPAVYAATGSHPYYMVTPYETLISH